LPKSYNIAIPLRKEVKQRMFGSQDIILIGIIVVVLFGASKLPQLGSGIGQAIRNFKKGIAESEEIEAPRESAKKESAKKEEKQKEEGG
jgi:sec-independent protein translocase protein TatA